MEQTNKNQPELVDQKKDRRTESAISEAAIDNTKNSAKRGYNKKDLLGHH